MRTPVTLGTLLATATLGLTASTASAMPYTDCGNLSETVGAIKAKNVSCAKAKKVVKKHQVDGMDHQGYTCKYRAYDGGVTWTCKKAPNKVVRYSIAD